MYTENKNIKNINKRKKMFIFLCLTSNDIKTNLYSKIPVITS